MGGVLWRGVLRQMTANGDEGGCSWIRGKRASNSHLGIPFCYPKRKEVQCGDLGTRSLAEMSPSHLLVGSCVAWLSSFNVPNPNVVILMSNNNYLPWKWGVLNY